MGLNLKEIPTLSAEELFGDKFQPVPMESLITSETKTNVKPVQEEKETKEKPTGSTAKRKPYVRKK